jgi:diguanylate cyclase (GGDEF)-like protein
VVIGIGAVVLLGSLFNVALLAAALPGLATMKINTAVGLVAGGVALWNLHGAAPDAAAFRVARGLAAFLAVLGFATFAQELFGMSLGIDELIRRDPLHAPTAVSPGRMSPATSLCFFLVGLALLALKARDARVAAGAHWLVVVPLFVATLAGVGHAYGVSALYEVKPYTSMAAHTALSLFILTLALLTADRGHGLARIAAGDTAGSVVSRRLVPTITLILFVLGWATLAGQEAGLYDTRFGLALMVLLSIAVCVAAIAWTAVKLQRVDIARRGAEAGLLRSYAELEQRVAERTEELAHLSAALGVNNKLLEQVALEDGLTGLANRRSFDAYLAAQVALARRRGAPLALVMVDVDDFKGYNDRHGHQAGDECLRQVAAALRACCRRPGDMAARYGGEEFAMVLPDTDLAGATRLAEAARAAVTQLALPHARDASPFVSISGGVAVLSRDAAKGEARLVAAADQALYLAKGQGRNRIVAASAEAAMSPVAHTAPALPQNTTA